MNRSPFVRKDTWKPLRAKRKTLQPRSDSTRKALEAAWDKEIEAQLAHVVWCENCGATGVRLDRAHRLKRNKIPVKNDIEAWKAEYFMVAKLCRKCHNDLDFATGEDVHGRMFEAVTRLIAQRDTSEIN